MVDILTGGMAASGTVLLSLGMFVDAVVGVKGNDGGMFLGV